jgi:hypothetical protein
MKWVGYGHILILLCFSIQRKTQFFVPTRHRFLNFSWLFIVRVIAGNDGEPMLRLIRRSCFIQDALEVALHTFKERSRVAGWPAGCLSAECLACIPIVLHSMQPASLLSYLTCSHTCLFRQQSHDRCAIKKAQTCQPPETGLQKEENHVCRRVPFRATRGTLLV